MSTSTPPEQQQQNLRYTLLILFLINFLNFFDRAIPAVVLEPIRAEFKLNDTMLGLLGTGFTLIYALAGLPIGRLSDRVPRTRVLAVGVFVWSLMTAASGFAWNFVSLFLIRLGVGIGEASCAPAANSMIGDMYPAQKRARALGFFMLGLPIANLACFSLVGYLAQRYGWRTPFLLAALPGFALAVLAWRLREPVRGAQESYRVDADKTIANPYRKLMRIPTLWWIILSGAALNFAAYALGTFLPSLMIRYHHTSVAQAGMVAALVLGGTGIIALGVGGWISDRAHSKHSSGRLRLGSACLLAASPLLWLGLTQPAGAVALTALYLSVGWAMFFMYFVTVYPSVQDVVEPQLRASAMALYFFFQYVLGAGFGTVITGILSDHYARQAMRIADATELNDSFRAIGLQSSMSIVVPLAILLTGVALWFAAGRFSRDVAQVRARSAVQA